MAKSVLSILLKSLGIMAVFYFVYYFFYVKPRVAVPRIILEAEKEYSNDYLALKENRLFISSFLTLNTKSPTFLDDKNKIVSNFAGSNKNALEELEKKPDLSRIEGAQDEVSRFVTELSQKINELASNGTGLLKKQQELISKLENNAKILNDLYEYNPDTDLANRDLSKEKEEILERLARSKKGLSDTFSAIQKNKLVDTQSTQDFQNVLENLADLTESVEDQDKLSYEQGLAKYKEGIEKIKLAGFLNEASVLTNEQSIDLIKKETNLIVEYEKVLSQIKTFKEKKRLKL